MTDSAKAARTTIGGDNADSLSALLRTPPFWPDDVELWFTILEVQFRTAKITCDHVKFHTAVANLDKQHVRLIKDILNTPPETDCYQILKKELIKRLGESDAKRLRRALQNKPMGDRSPSQFYRDLKNLATSAIADDVILTLWEGRLSLRVRSALASVQTRDPEIRIQLADSIFEAIAEPGHRGQCKPAIGDNPSGRAEQRDG
jgi:hypothetical protein